jgi:hypothetical protein
MRGNRLSFTGSTLHVMSLHGGDEVASSALTAQRCFILLYACMFDYSCSTGYMRLISGSSLAAVQIACRFD